MSDIARLFRPPQYRHDLISASAYEASGVRDGTLSCANEACSARMAFRRAAKFVKGKRPMDAFDPGREARRAHFYCPDVTEHIADCRFRNERRDGRHTYTLEEALLSDTPILVNLDLDCGFSGYQTVYPANTRKGFQTAEELWIDAHRDGYKTVSVKSAADAIALAEEIKALGRKHSAIGEDQALASLWYTHNGAIIPHEQFWVADSAEALDKTVRALVARGREETHGGHSAIRLPPRLFYFTLNNMAPYSVYGDTLSGQSVGITNMARPYLVSNEMKLIGGLQAGEIVEAHKTHMTIIAAPRLERRMLSNVAQMIASAGPGLRIAPLRWHIEHTAQIATRTQPFSEFELRAHTETTGFVSGLPETGFTLPRTKPQPR